MKKYIKIGKRLVGFDKEPLVVAEIGINHNEYSHTTKLNESNVKSLLEDFI